MEAKTSKYTDLFGVQPGPGSDIEEDEPSDDQDLLQALQAADDMANSDEIPNNQAGLMSDDGTVLRANDFFVEPVTTAPQVAIVPPKRSRKRVAEQPVEQGQTTLDKTVTRKEKVVKEKRMPFFHRCGNKRLHSRVFAEVMQKHPVNLKKIDIHAVWAQKAALKGLFPSTKYNTDRCEFSQVVLTEEGSITKTKVDPLVSLDDLLMIGAAYSEVMSKGKEDYSDSQVQTFLDQCYAHIDREMLYHPEAMPLANMLQFKGQEMRKEMADWQSPEMQSYLNQLDNAKQAEHCQPGYIIEYNESPAPMYSGGLFKKRRY